MWGAAGEMECWRLTNMSGEWPVFAILHVAVVPVLRKCRQDGAIERQAVLQFPPCGRFDLQLGQGRKTSEAQSPPRPTRFVVC